jgi:predicted Zn-dependent peptidase
MKRVVFKILIIKKNNKHMKEKNILQFEKYKLANGVRVVLLPDNKAVSTIAQVLVETGSKYETKRLNGISHFVEHMVFKGTKKRPSTKIIAEEIDNVGGQMNAFTGQEETGYWIKVPAKHSQLALEVVADIYLNPLIDKREVERERGVILQEMAMINDSPARKIEDIFTDLLYGNQPAGWSIIGTEKNIKKIQAEDLRNYMQKKYSPQKTVVTVAGNFNSEKIKKSIKEFFEVKKRQRGGTMKKVVEKQNKPQIKMENKETDQTHLVLGFRAFDMFDKRRYALGLLSSILGGGMSSRMFLKIREREGLAYYIHTASELNLDSGVFVVQAGVGHNNLEKTVKLILQEIKRISQKQVFKKELQKAKDKLAGNIVMGLETTQAKAGFVANQELYRQEIKTVDYILEQYEKVTVVDIQKVAQDIFRNSKLNLAIIGPQGGKEEDL